MKNLEGFVSKETSSKTPHRNVLSHEQGSNVHIIPFSIPFGIDKFERNGGKFFLNNDLKKNWGHFYLIGDFFVLN